MRDARIREHYEFYFMHYPTGRGMLINSVDLRCSLVRLKNAVDPNGTDPAMHHIVFIGHSMGGLIGRLLSQDSGNKMWQAYWNAPIGELDLQPNERKALETTYFFRRLPFVDRIVFMVTPHAGSPVASRPIGWLGKNVADLPIQFKSVIDSVANKRHLKTKFNEDVFTSVRGLQSGSPVLSALAVIPRSPEVSYHSIIGTRAEANDPKGDGIVPLESARIDWGESTIQVPAKHIDIHEHPLTIKEVHRILVEHYQNVAW